MQMKTDATSLILVCDDSPSERELFVMTAGITGATSEIQLVPIGDWNGKAVSDGPGKTKYISFSVTESDIAQMVNNFAKLGRDLVVDYEHQTLSGEEAPAAGWIKQLVDKGKDGLWAMVEWTDRAKQYLSSREYRYLSPVFTLNGVDRKSGLKSGAMLLNAALTNDPFFSELKPIVSKTTQGVEQKTSFTFLSQEIPMNKLIARLREIYNLAAEATEDDIIAKVDGMHASAAPAISAKTEIFAALGLSATATVEEAKARIVAAKQGSENVQTLQTRIASMEADRLNERAEAIVAKGVNDGKILPASKEHMMSWAKKDLTGFEAYIAKAAVIGPITPIGDVSGDTRATGVTDVDLLVAKNLGVSADALKKHNAN